MAWIKKFYIRLDRVLANMEDGKTGDPMAGWGKTSIKNVERAVLNGKLKIEVIEINGKGYLKIDIPVGDVLFGEGETDEP